MKEIEFDKFIGILKHLIRCPGVVGSEHPFFLELKREFDEMGIKTYQYEGVLVAEGSKPKSGYISAHIDRQGLICTAPGEFQYASYKAGSSVNLKKEKVINHQYKLFVERFMGERMQGYEPYSGKYLGIGVVEDIKISTRRDSILFKVKGLEQLEVGTPLAYLDRVQMDDKYLWAQIDNIISAATILYMFKNGYEGSAFFTAGEEAGQSWKYLIEFFQRRGKTSDELLVIDTSPFATREEADAQDVILRDEDANASFDSPLKKRILDICKRDNISYTFKCEYIKEYNEGVDVKKPRSLGTTELGRVIDNSDEDIQGITLQIPTTDYHTSHETASIESTKKFIDLLLELYCKGDS